MTIRCHPMSNKHLQLYLGHQKRGDASRMDSGDCGSMSGRVFRTAIQPCLPERDCKGSTERI